MEQESTSENTSPYRRKQEIKKWGTRVFVFLLVMSGLLYTLNKVSFALSHESTDNAFVEGRIVPISAEVKGRVTRVLIDDNQIVSAGAPLVEIAPEDYNLLVKAKEIEVSRISSELDEIKASIDVKNIELIRARAALDAAKANESYHEKEYRRYSNLRKSGMAQSRIDQAESAWKTSMASRQSASASIAEIKAAITALEAQVATQKHRVEEAVTSLEQARLDLEHTVILAPMNGRIAKKSVNTGMYVQPGQPLFAIVDVENLWVVANFKETQTAGIKPGQEVEIRVDAYPDIEFKGHVDSIQPGTGAAFSLLPPQNATGNFVKVVQRVPVKIAIDSEPDLMRLLRPGLSAFPVIHVKGKS